MEHPYCPDWVDELWGRPATMVRWAQVEIAAAEAAGAHPDVVRRLMKRPVPTSAAWGGGSHEMIAFLEVWLDGLGPEVTTWVHRGLTSSDVIDTATAIAIGESSSEIASGLIVLQSALGAVLHDSVVGRLGRTHTAPAAPVSLEHQCHVLMVSVARHRSRLRTASGGAVRVMASGPMGEDNRRTEALSEVLQIPGSPATLQALPREHWAPWWDAMTGIATWAEHCSRFLWTGIRDGDLVLTQGPGSSSMPHKVNASRLERVWGLARLARGYRSALAESVAMWDERDLGHSSVERVALPGLVAVTSTAIEEILEVLSNIEIDRDRCTQRLVEAGDAIHSHQRALRAQSDGAGYFEARETAMTGEGPS